jgi:hypothetical protein
VSLVVRRLCSYCAIMPDQLVDLMLRCDKLAIEQLCEIAKESPDLATSLVFDFLRRSSENGRYIWGGFRKKVIHLLIDSIGRTRVEQQLVSAWVSFPEESRLDFAYDVIGDSDTLSNAVAERLFFHEATSAQCKGDILDGLLQTRERRNLGERYFYGLLKELSSKATPANRDEVELSCIEMYHLIRNRLDLAN